MGYKKSAMETLTGSSKSTGQTRYCLHNWADVKNGILLEKDYGNSTRERGASLQGSQLLAMVLWGGLHFFFFTEVLWNSQNRTFIYFDFKCHTFLRGECQHFKKI